MLILWMRDATVTNCREIMSGLVDLCEFLKANERGIGMNVSDSSIMYEIGSFAGESAEVFARYFDFVHCVDPWTSDPNICGLDARSTFNCEDVQRSFDERAAKAGNMIKHVGYSADVVKTVPDGTLDFVYVDALHQLANVKANIAEWWPKVRSGGFIGGHDYHDTVMNSDFQVKQAVQEFVASEERAIGLRLFADTSWIVRKS
jgi:hypothetical protein